MKKRNYIEINSKSLASHLSALRSVVERKITIPVLGMVLVESMADDRLRLTATDLDHTLKIEARHDGDFDGSLCVNLDKLLGVCRSLREQDVTITSLDNGWAEIGTERGKVKIAGISREQFPATAVAKGTPYECEASDFLDGLNAVLHDAADYEHERWELRGVQFEVNGHLRFVSTDGASMSLCDVTPKQPFLSQGGEPLFAWLIPRKAAQAVKASFDRSAKITCWADDNNITFEQGAKQLTTRRPTQPFVQYDPTLKQASEKIAEMDTAELSSTVNLVAAFAQADQAFGYKVARFELDGDEITISAKNSDGEEVSETLACRYEGEALAGYDVKRVHEALRFVVGDTKVKIEPDKILALESSTDRLKLRQFIFPMRL